MYNHCFLSRHYWEQLNQAILRLKDEALSKNWVSLRCSPKTKLIALEFMK